MHQRHVEIAVGMAVIASFVALAGFALQQFAGSSDSYAIHAEFASVAGLQVGDPVEIAGVEVGRVASIGLRGGRASIRLQIDSDAEIQDDSLARVASSSWFVGDKRIAVTPGRSGRILMPGGTLRRTRSATDVTDLIVNLVTGDFMDAVAQARSE